MDYFIDKYEQLEQTNRLLENIEAKLNAMNIPQVEQGHHSLQYSNLSQSRNHSTHPMVDNYLLNANGSQINDQSKSNEYPTLQMSTQVLQDDLLISGYDQFKSATNQFNSGLSFAQTNKQQPGNSSTNTTQWTVLDGNNNSKVLVNAYQSTEKINNLLLGETESQLIDSDPKRSNNLQFNHQTSQNTNSDNFSGLQVSNSQRSNRSKSWNKNQQKGSSKEDQKQVNNNSNNNNVGDSSINKSNVSNASSKSSKRSKQNDVKSKGKQMYIGSGQKEQLIKIEENNIGEDELDDDHSNQSPFVKERNDQQNVTQHYSPISLDYTKSLNNTQNNHQNMLNSLSKIGFGNSTGADFNQLKNNSQLEDELNTLRNRLYQINHSYTKLAQQQSLSDFEVQNSQKKIYSLAEQMKNIAESLQNMNQLQFTSKIQKLNNGYAFNNDLGESRSFSSGKKINKLSADKYEEVIIDDKVFLLEKENRRLKKENQMLKDEIEDYKEKMNKLFSEHQSTRQSLEKHLELKYETSILNMKEAQKIIISEKDSKIQILQRQVDEIKSERETMKKELFSFRQSLLTQRANANTSVYQNQHSTSFENKSQDNNQPYIANYYLKNNNNDRYQPTKDVHNQSLIENSILSQNYGASNSYLDQKRQLTTATTATNNNNNSYDNHKLLTEKTMLTDQPLQYKMNTINDYVRTDIDTHLLKNSKTVGADLHHKKSRQSSEYIKTDRVYSKDKTLNAQKPPKLKKGIVPQENNHTISNNKKSRSKSPINYSEQISHLIKQNENLKKLKAQLKTESSLSNSRKETQANLLPTTTLQNKKQKKASPKRSKSSMGQRNSNKI